MSGGLVTAAYIVAAILFIFSLAGLSKHETSQQGNNFGIAGMAIALIATIFGPDTGNVAWILVAMIIGGAIGIRLAKKVEMTEMPELVAVLHSFVGLAAGASVTHVDASKGMVAWARENAQASSLADRPCRWIVDDCAKFVQREIRRGSRYDAVIMDPPSYGRGPNGEIWKLEDNVYDLITLTEQVLSDKPLFFAINSYTEGLSPAVMEYVLKTTLCPKVGGHTSCDEIGLPVTATGGVVPCGATAVWEE